MGINLFPERKVPFIIVAIIKGMYDIWSTRSNIDKK